MFFGNSNLGGQVLIWYWDGIRGTELRLGPLRTKGVEGDFKTEMEVWFHIRIKLVSTSKLKYHIKQDNDWSQKNDEFNSGEKAFVVLALEDF